MMAYLVCTGPQNASVIFYIFVLRRSIHLLRLLPHIRTYRSLFASHMVTEISRIENLLKGVQIRVELTFES